jgi:hypothetical protein
VPAAVLVASIHHSAWPTVARCVSLNDEELRIPTLSNAK